VNPFRFVASLFGLREVTAACGAALLWWGAWWVYRPAAPILFGVLLLLAAFGPKRKS
jgi:hypothetical protein